MVIICSNIDEEKSHIISMLHVYRKHYIFPRDCEKYRKYLRKHFMNDEDGGLDSMDWTGTIRASDVDFQRYHDGS